MNVVFTGGRQFQELGKAIAVFEALDPMNVFVGDCPTGFDKMVREYFMDHKLHVFDAEWLKYGKRAGPIRNRKMLEQAIARHGKGSVLVVAAPGGAGTNGCVALAKELGAAAIVRIE